MVRMTPKSPGPAYASRMLRGGALIFTSTIVSSLLGYMLRLFFSRTLTVEEYGLLYAVVVFVNFFVLFRDLGLNQALVKFIPEWVVRRQPGKARSAILWVVKFQALVAALAGGIIFVVSPWLADAYFHAASSVVMLQIMAGTFFVAVFGAIFTSSLQGMQRIRAFSFLQPLNNLFPLAFAAAFVALGFGLAGAAGAYFAGGLAFSVLAGAFLIGALPGARQRIDSGDKKRLIDFALPVMLGFIGGAVLGSTDTIVLTYFRSLSEVGLYQAALPTSQVLWTAAIAIGAVLFPMVSEMWAKRDLRALSKGVSLLLRFSFMLVLPFALMMLAWPEFVLTLLFGEAYIAGALALQVLALAALAYTLWQICAVVLAGLGRPDITTKIMIAAAVINLVSNIALVQALGMVGVALTTLVSFVLAFGAAFLALNRIVELRLGGIAILKSAISGLVMVAVILGIKSVLVLNPWVEVVISLVAGLAVYSVLVLRLRAVSRDELDMLSKLAVPVPRFVFRAARAVAGNRN